MGQTLTHGVYLPDEGERNCYAGLAANWQILDGSVGTIAAHTAALAGKAPLVHTHTKSDITDFPAYGTTAGTICEGNDSRLSDARTPVAHTHTKSDVTDLLNSNFIPSANNSYDLGSASYQWKSVYAQSYYYNGVAWGLDKANVWTGINDFNNLIGLNGAELWFKNKYIDDFTTNPAEQGGQSVLQIWNKNTTQYSGGLIDYQMTDGSHILEITCFGYPLNNPTPHQHRFRFAAYRDGVADFYPTLNSVNLGTSSNKWKSLNGINPGALSLPIFGTADRKAVDTTDWVLDGSAANTFTPIISGWLNIRISDIEGNYVIIQSGALTVSNHGAGVIPSSVITRALAILFPVEAGTPVSIRLNTTSVAGFIYPCQGNV